jgi:hypothetical protein
MAWFREYHRHSLAARGIPTSRYAFSRRRKPGQYELHGHISAKTRQGIPITIQKPAAPGKSYPITPQDAKKALDKLPDASMRGIKEINFRDPGLPMTKQDKAWAQYVRSQQRINVFSQPYKNGEFIEAEPENRSPDAARRHMEEYVLPHEVGHHRAAKKDPDLPIIVEEAKADAFAAKENPEDRATVESYIEDRQIMFGSKGTI